MLTLAVDWFYLWALLGKVLVKAHVTAQLITKGSDGERRRHVSEWATTSSEHNRASVPSRGHVPAHRRSYLYLGDIIS